MPKNRKLRPHNACLFVTSRTEEGLPFVPNPLMNFILSGILARAKELYSVKVCHFVYLANHFHMLLVIDTPEHVSDFIGYIKSESASALNILLNRPKKTIWCEGFDEEIVLDSKRVLEIIDYIYLNPARADLVESIRNYPGLSSWDMFVAGEHSFTAQRVGRDKIPQLGTTNPSSHQQKSIIQDFRQEGLRESVFFLEPDAWLNSFSDHDFDASQLKQQIVQRVERIERRLSRERSAAGKRVLGRLELTRQNMAKSYMPTKRTKRKFCTGTCVEVVQAFVEMYRKLCEQGKRAYQAWKLGDFSVEVPIGLIAPKPPSKFSLLPLAL